MPNAMQFDRLPQEPPQEPERDTRIAHRLSCVANEIRTQSSYVIWLAAWAVALIIATALLAGDLNLPTPLRWLLAVAPTGLAIKAGVSYTRSLRNADELMRTIQIEALALAVGAGLLFGVGYPLLEYVGAPELGVSSVAVVLSVGFIGGYLNAGRRYR